VLVLALGFDHVSDDDYARVTIAQSFAVSPRLDPSGTSWLPFPFWALGSVMIAVGRSLAVARVASIAFASLAVGALYVALRAAGIRRTRAILGVAFATLSPWSLWLGAATVPESFTASFMAAAAIGLGSRDVQDRPSLWLTVGLASGLLAACLSRYEAWPVAAVLALALARRALRTPREAPASARARAASLVVTALVAAGPLVWMAWNLHAHGDALHFFARVSRFKRALGEGSTDTLAALLLYPRLLATMRPDVLLAAVVAALIVARTESSTRAQVARRWLVPLLCAAAQLLFLAYGNARDGAPAHHSERALLGVVFITSAFAADVVAGAAGAALARSRPRAALGALALVGSWLATTALGLRDIPGTTAGEDRTAQLAMGHALRTEGVPHLELTPCAYEHFALISAFAAPELVTTRASTGAKPSTACPTVERR
jgi:hypothetical protein